MERTCETPDSPNGEIEISQVNSWSTWLYGRSWELIRVIATCCLTCFITIVKPFLTLILTTVHTIYPIWKKGSRRVWSIDRGCLLLHGTWSYSDIFRGPCTTILWFVFPIGLIRLNTVRYCCLFIYTSIPKVRSGILGYTKGRRYSCLGFVWFQSTTDTVRWASFKRGIAACTLYLSKPRVRIQTPSLRRCIAWGINCLGIKLISKPKALSFIGHGPKHVLIVNHPAFQNSAVNLTKILNCPIH
jgi:hypothetical protein